MFFLALHSLTQLTGRNSVHSKPSAAAQKHASQAACFCFSFILSEHKTYVFTPLQILNYSYHLIKCNEGNQPNSFSSIQNPMIKRCLSIYLMVKCIQKNKSSSPVILIYRIKAQQTVHISISSVVFSQNVKLFFLILFFLTFWLFLKVYILFYFCFQLWRAKIRHLFSFFSGTQNIKKYYQGSFAGLDQWVKETHSLKKRNTF